MTITIDVHLGANLMQSVTAAHLDEYDLLATENKSGSGPIVIDSRLPDGSAHPAIRHLDEDGAWVRVEHDGQLLFTALIEDDEGPFGNSDDTSRTYVLRDHWCLFEHTPALVAPGNPISPAENESGLGQLAQVVATGPTTPGSITNLAGYFVWAGPSAETAVRDIVTRNFTALGIQHRWASEDQQRGANPTLPDVRMIYLSEAIVPVLEAAGLRIDIWREGDTYVLDIVEPGEYAPHLTLDGPLRPGRFKRKRLGVTDIMHGGPGVEAARDWSRHTDAALAAAQDHIWFAFRDGTGYSPVWGAHLADGAKSMVWYLSRSDADVAAVDKNEYRSYRSQNAREALADGAPSASLQVEIEQSGGFVFPTGYQLGTRLKMTEHLKNGAPDGPVFHDRVVSVRVQKPRGKDETVTPQVGGARQSAAARLRADVAALAARQRRQSIQK